MKSPFVCLSMLLICLAPVLSVSQDSRINEEIVAVENGLLLPIKAEGVTAPMPLLKRMEDYTISAVSIAVIKDYKILWAKVYGHSDPELTQETNTETLFRACSLSKPVAAALALHLSEKGTLPIDADIRTLLTSWKVPDSEFAVNGGPTIRQIIAHRAGFNVHGFGTYTESSAQPTLLQILNGAAPATNPKIELIYAPGSEKKYSGGGYEVLHQLLEDQYSESFAELITKELLKPLGMDSSVVAPSVPKDRRNNAAVGRYNGGVIEGLFGVNPELAAAGLFTTSSDYARFCIAVMNAWNGKDTELFSRTTAHMYIEDELGVFKGETDGRKSFYHGGVTALYESYMFCYPDTGDGAVIMINGNCGGKLIKEIYRSIAAAYSWPDYLPVEKKLVQVADEALKLNEGTYDVDGKWQFTIKANAGRLDFYFGDDTNASPLYPESEASYFDPADGTVLTFNKNTESSRIDEVVIMNSRGEETVARRIITSE